MLAAAAVMVLAGFALLATGCNTVSGVGEDISAAGQTLADWATPDSAPKKK
jgi:predicted small secreted protein